MDEQPFRILLLDESEAVITRLLASGLTKETITIIKEARSVWPLIAEHDLLLIHETQIAEFSLQDFEHFRRTKPALSIVTTISDGFPIAQQYNGYINDSLALQEINEASIKNLFIHARQHCHLIQSLSELLVQHSALYHSQTGLPHQALLLDRLQQTLAFCQHHKKRAALLLITIKNNYLIKNHVGENGFSIILKEMSKRLAACVQAPNTVAHFSDDQFMVLLANIEQENRVYKTAQIIQRVLAEPISLELEPQFIHCAIGIALYPEDGLETKHLLNHVDEALQLAKNNDASPIYFYNQAEQEKTYKNIDLEKSLRIAWVRGEFAIYCQPQIQLLNQKLHSLVMDIRWLSPENGLIDQKYFQCVADETGLLLPLGDWLLRTACEMHQTWNQAGLPATLITLPLNLQQIRRENMSTHLENLLHQCHFPPHLLSVEISEFTLMREKELSRQQLLDLHEIGINIVVCDYGRANVGQGFLRDLPIHAVKIDRGFYSEVHKDPDSADYIRALISVAHSLHKEIIAVDVDNEEDKNFLADAGCRMMQGALWSRPLPLAESITLFEEPWIKIGIQK